MVLGILEQQHLMLLCSCAHLGVLARLLEHGCHQAPGWAPKAPVAFHRGKTFTGTQCILTCPFLTRGVSESLPKRTRWYWWLKANPFPLQETGINPLASQACFPHLPRICKLYCLPGTPKLLVFLNPRVLLSITGSEHSAGWFIGSKV